MGHLDQLDISRRVILTRRQGRRRDLDYQKTKLVASLEEQIELATAVIEGRPPQLKRKRGKGVVTVRPRLWWEVSDAGHVATQIRFNRKALRLKGQGSTIEVGPMKKLPGVYRTVIKAVEAGELDQAILATLSPDARASAMPVTGRAGRIPGGRAPSR